MDIVTSSFHEIELKANKPFPEQTALISIGDVGSRPPKFTHQPKWYLRLEFDDIHPRDVDYESSGSYAFRLFSSEQAKAIANFVCMHKDEIKLLICQCKYGQSRSAAVAAAISQHLNGDGIKYFANKNYCPNVLVFSMTLEALNNHK